MKGALDQVLAAWTAHYALHDAYATTEEARAALVRAGVDTVMLDGATEPRELVVTELYAYGEAEVQRVAALATKGVVVLVPNTRRAFSRHASAREVGPLLWGIGRVRERELLDMPGGGLEMLPPRFLGRLAKREAYYVDLVPRTRQARRKLLRTAP